LRSPSPFAWLLRKEWRELMASRAWWVLAGLTGPLVGLSFINGVRAFSEVSAGAGTGCGLACAPLVGIWGPTFGAYEISAAFLLPFVAIRLLANDRQSGAMTIEMQGPMSASARILAKAIVLLTGWMLTGLAAIVAIALWKSYGGHADATEITAVALGHLLNGALTIALAMAIAAVTDHPSTAAIIALAITIGTWVIDFAAAIEGGIWTTIAGYTPTAIVTLFQHALVQTNVTVIAILAIAAALGIAVFGIEIGRSVRERAWRSTWLASTALVAILAATTLRGSWDASESRQNSFGEPEQEALEALPAPLAIDIHLSPQDPRRRQFERGPLAKLKRATPYLKVTYSARTSSGLYEQTDNGYGEIRYTMAGRSETTRVITDEGALETIFDVAKMTPPSESDAPYMGHPFTGRAAGAPLVFYGIWPVLAIAAGMWTARRHA
jgi:ABC-2 type transport system permease protein